MDTPAFVDGDPAMTASPSPAATSRVPFASRFFMRDLPPGRAYGEVVAVIAAVTAVSLVLPLSFEAFGHLYLLAVIALSLRVGRLPALFAAILSALAWDFVFVPPRLSLRVLDVDDMLLLGSYFVTALVGGQLAAQIRSLQREREKLLATSERLHRTLLDSVSHELKTPLSVLRSAGEKLDTDDPGKRARLVAEVQRAVQRLDHLVANLLDQTRLQSGAISPSLDWCDVRELVAAARRNFAEALAGRTLLLDIPDDLPLCRADAVLMEHVLGNLLLNVARHTPPACHIRIAAGLEGDRFFIAVSDNGPGLPPELADNPFQSFRQGRKASAGGLGLGLSIVQGFMLVQGGGVTARNAPEGGAHFTVYLPHATHETIPDDDV